MPYTSWEYFGELIQVDHMKVVTESRECPVSLPVTKSKGILSICLTRKICCADPLGKESVPFRNPDKDSMLAEVLAMLLKEAKNKRFGLFINGGRSV